MVKVIFIQQFVEEFSTTCTSSTLGCYNPISQILQIASCVSIDSI